MHNDLQIVHLTKSKLRASLESDLFWQGSLVPMPRSKAFWLLKNNRIEEEDYCGVIALENNIMVAFIYMIPDYLKISDTAYLKVYWDLIWWVDKAYKKTILGSYVFNESLNLAQKKVIIKSFADHMNEFYKKQPFNEIVVRPRHTLFFYLDREAILVKFSFLRYFKGVITFIGIIIDFVFRFLNKSKVKKNTKLLELKKISHLDSLTWEFIEPLCKDDLILKSKEYIDWQLDESQYTQTNNIEMQAKSIVPGSSENIKINKITIFKDGALIGFMAYLINYNEFNVKYFLVEDDRNYKYCVDALIKYFIQEKANYMYTDNAKLSSAINHRFRVIYTYKSQKKALIHNSIDLGTKAFQIKDQDGHFY